MTWTEDWYPSTIEGFVDVRGAGANDARGVAMPLLRPLDCIAVLGQLSQPIRVAIANLQSDNASHQDRCLPSFVLDGGTLVESTNTVYGDGGITIADYVAGYGVPGAGWMRGVYKDVRDQAFQQTLPVASRAQTYELWRTLRDLGNEEAYLALAHQLMNAWQRGVDVASAAIKAAGANLVAAPMSTTYTAELLTATRQMCACLDVMHENVPLTNSEKIKAAARSALDKTETFVGEAAAGLAGEAGRIAGNIGRGFFDEAGLTAIMVAGVAVYLFIL